MRLAEGTETKEGDVNLELSTEQCGGSKTDAVMVATEEGYTPNADGGDVPLGGGTASAEHDVDDMSEDERGSLENSPAGHETEDTMPDASPTLSHPLVWQDVRVSFDAGICAEQFAIHMFLPFSIVYVYSRYGLPALKVQYFWVTSGDHLLSSLLSTYVYPAIQWLAIIVYAIYRSRMRDSNISVLDLLISFSLFVTHRLMIALKYASLTQSEYHALLQHGEGSHRMQCQLQLISGWFHPDPLIQEVELHAAGERQDVILRNFSLTVPPPVQIHGRTIEADPREDWLGLLRRYGRENATWMRDDGTMKVCTESYALALIARATANTDKVNQLILVFVALLFALVPGLCRLAWSGCHSMDANCNITAFFGRSVPETIVVVCCFTMSFVWFTTNTFFLVISCVDLIRLQSLLTLCNDAIRITHDKYQHRDPTRRRSFRGGPQEVCKHRDIPRIDFTIPSNVRAWTYLRVVLNDWGRRYRTRLSAFFVVALAMSFILTLILTLKVVVLFNNAQRLRDATYAYQIIFLVVAWTTLCVLYVGVGSFINDLYSKSRRQLVRHRCLLQDIEYRLVDEQRLIKVASGHSEPHPSDLGARLRALREQSVPLTRKAKVPRTHGGAGAKHDQEATQQRPRKRVSSHAVALVKLQPSMDASEQVSTVYRPSLSSLADVSELDAGGLTPPSGPFGGAFSGPKTPISDRGSTATLAGVDHDRIAQCHALIESAMVTLETLEASKPVRALGAKADMNLASSIITILLTVLAFLFQQIWLE